MRGEKHNPYHRTLKRETMADNHASRERQVQLMQKTREQSRSKEGMPKDHKAD